MRVERIKITHFKSIYDTLELDFRDFEGVWKIGGDVGSGKTTIGEAIMFGLFGTISGKNNTTLLSWGENHGEVEMWCQSKGHNLHIHRTINKYGQSPVTAWVDDEELVYTNKRDAQSQLETDYYDISRRPLELLCIMSFNNFKSLATLNTSETRKFLDQILGFYILTNYVDVCNEMRSLTKKQIANLTTKLAGNQAQIQKIQDLASQTRVEGNIDDIKARIKKINEEYKTKADAFSSEHTRLQHEYNEATKKLAGIRALGVNKKKEIDFIMKGVCPTCGAPIDQSQLEIKQQEKQALADQYIVVNGEVEKLAGEIKRVTDIHNTDLWKKDSVVRELERELTLLEEQERRSKVDTTEIDKLEEVGRQIQQNLNQQVVDNDEWGELINILSNDVRSKVLAGFIPTLNRNILKYTSQLGQRYVVEFDTDFNCSIHISGMKDPIPVSSLSTGQMKTVDMCIIMGMLGTVLNSISFNITFLDELLSNMDTELRQTMCQVFHVNHQPGHTTFVLSHTDIDSKYFDGIITAELKYMDNVRQKSVYKIEKNALLRNV